jgi:hypothetical protein
MMNRRRFMMTSLAGAFAAPTHLFIQLTVF